MKRTKLKVERTLWNQARMQANLDNWKRFERKKLSRPSRQSRPSLPPSKKLRRG